MCSAQDQEPSAPAALLHGPQRSQSISGGQRAAGAGAIRSIPSRERWPHLAAWTDRDPHRQQDDAEEHHLVGHTI
ncbi:protein of unknown function [Cyanobium sp. NIES-981]|nr:protein of unknown function [Cyanobium sp. NIES-981]